jgi:hypothetical protein
MSTVQLGPILQKLDQEVFFAILDVALDIDGKLAVADEHPIYIESTRTVVRFQVLCPGATVGAMYRYVELREMGLKFLAKHHIIDSHKYHQLGMAGFDGRFGVMVKEPRLIEEALIQLRAEQNRRYPGQKMEHDIQSAVARLGQLADTFPSVVRRLLTRRTGRDSLVIGDEYDVQYLFAALLETRFEDIRPEEWGPSYAGGPNRVDFLLKNEFVLIETKMTRDGLTDRKLGEELIIDVDHYKQMKECRALVCFVYDPDHRLRNPRGIENDLSKVTDRLAVNVLIRPKS